MKSLLSHFYTLLVAAGPVLASSLSLQDTQDPFTFSYSTDSPDDTNWVGIFQQGQGPADGEHVEDSVEWAYAPGSDGSVFLPADDMPPGDYDVYFLAEDAYGSLADPISVTVEVRDVRFYPSRGITLHNARVGHEYSARLGGLVDGGGHTDILFSLVGDGSSWARISEATGVLSGTPRSSGSETLTVLASAGSSSAELQVTVPIVEGGDHLVPRLAVMSFNIWQQGANVRGSFAKQVAFLSEANVDVLGLQETGPETTAGLAQALGWNAYQHGSHGTAILARYPIAEELDQLTAGLGARIDLGGGGGGSAVSVWNVHLGYTPYGPYDFCFDGLSADEVLENETRSGRTPQIREAVSAMGAHLDEADAVPVFLLGDFNSPSELDWTDDNRHCGGRVGAVRWPASEVPRSAGLVDSLRELHPDPARDPHHTWSPIYKANEDYGGRDEPQDRIDFVYHKGRSVVVEAADTVVRGEPRPEPDHGENEWPSDHRAVVVRFSL